MSLKPQQGVVYKITNLINGKIYIGKRQCNKIKFLQSSYWGSGKLITRAILKHGINNFIKEVIFNGDYNELDQKEIEYIKEYNCLCPNGYNIGHGGEGNNGGQNRGKKLSDEWKNKISNAKRGQMMGDENPMRRPEIRNQFLNHPVTQETRNKISKKNSGKIRSKQHKENISKGMKELYQRGYENNRKGFKKINGVWAYIQNN